MKFPIFKYNHPGIKISLFETFTSRTALKETLSPVQFTVLLVNSGAVCIEINCKKIHLFVNELVVIPMRAVCEILIMGNQLQICQLSFTSEFALKNSIRWPHIGYFEFFVSPDCSKIYIPDKEIQPLIDLLKLINSKLLPADENLFREETILLGFNLFLYELARIYYRSAEYDTIKSTGNEKLVFQFFKLLELNCRKEHSVKFYSDALNVSRGYLNKTVKYVTEITAKQCIENAIILQAKILLQNNDLSILNISEELKFANTAFFSTFFKQHTSMTPSQFRSKFNRH